MSQILSHFDALIALGVQVIPLKANSKVPLCKNWPNDWNAGNTRRKLVQFPNSNIGILLGKIIDVEGDTLEANKKIQRLIGDFPHPCYESTRSTHHLFLNPNGIRHFRHDDIEFRGWGHQSVLPPSEHQGIKYRWTNSKMFPIPEMPPALLDYYLSKTKTKPLRSPLPPGCIKVYCDCGQSQIIHRKRYDLEIQVFMPNSWQCRKCRDIDIRKPCRALKKRLRQNF